MQSELTQEVLNLQAGDHLCLFYDKDPAEQMPALIPFIEDGLSKGEQCIYIADDHAVDELAARLEQSGVDVGKESDRGALKLWTRQEWRQPGALSSAKKLLQVSQFIDDASRAGFKGIRFAVEMTWILEPDISAEHLEHWEATLNTLFVPEFPGRIVCQYNRSRLNADVMFAALHTHPLVILGDHVHANLFYEAPLILNGNGNGNANAAAKVDWMIAQLKAARALAKEREKWIRRSSAVTEAELAREKMESIVSLMPAAVYTCDEAGRITFFNHRAAELWGREPRLGEDCDRFCGSFRFWRSDGTELHPSETPMAASRGDQPTRNEEVTIERPDGSRIVVNVNIAPLYSVAGRPCGAINVFQDITDSKWMQEASHLLPAIVESSDDAIISKNLNGVITSWNRGAEQLFGYTAEEAIGKSITMLIPPDRNDEEPGILARIRRGERIDHYETVRRRKDGRLVEISLTVSPVKDAKGKIIGASKVARDISDLKRANQELLRAKEELAKANEELEKRVQDRTLELAQAKAALLRDMEEQNKLQEQLRQAQKLESIGTLAGGIAHDFNNILNIIKGYVSELGKNPVADENAADSFKIIDDAIERGTATVRQLLTLARKTEAHLVSTNANDIVSELAKLLKQTLPKTVEVSLQLDRRLPCMMADPSQISQVLLNLCVNARDAMPSGGHLTLRTTLVHQRTVAKRHAEATAPWYVCLEVMDTGVGMDASVRSRIFEPFFTTKEMGQGTGLGLAIVYAIMQSHNGSIDVESEPGRGTTFRLHLPVASVKEESSGETARRESSEAKTAEGSGTILLAEDEENMVRLLKRVLCQRGYQVLVAADGAEAIDLFSRYSGDIDVVLLDIGLPKVAGWDVIRQLKEKDPAVRVVVASGYIEPELKSKMLEAGVKAVVHKPYAVANVIETLQDVIERSRTRLPGKEATTS